MSLSSTATIKAQINSQLGDKAPAYFDALDKFVSGRISRTEFEDVVLNSLDHSASLLQLHNALIISLFDATTYHKRLPTPPPEVPKPVKKRKRSLHEGGDDVSMHSTRLRKWAMGLGRRERERLRALQNAPPGELRPRPDMDEIARERGVVLLTERGEPPGGRLPLQLAQISRTPTQQHIADRINLIAAQHNLGNPNRQVSQLLMLAFEAKLKSIISQALTLTAASNSITSITPSNPLSSSSSSSSAPATTSSSSSSSPILTSASFDALFTLAPALLPGGSAAAMRLALGEQEPEEEEDLLVLKDREVRDQRWQMFALLGERSVVREALRGLR